MSFFRSTYVQTILAFVLGVTVFFTACKKDDDSKDDPPAVDGGNGSNGGGGGSNGGGTTVTPAGTLILSLSADCGDAPCM